jgi:hypothetical protein
MMALLFGKEYSKKNLLRYSGNLNQICGINNVCIKDGKANGMTGYIVKNGCGLEYTVLPDKCLDISSLSYRGVNISYLAKPGIVAPQYAYPAEVNLEIIYLVGCFLLVDC